METTLTIRKAKENDFVAVSQLLTADNLPTEDLKPLLENFFVALEEDKIIGVIGMDVYKNNALLRSAVVKQSHRNKGIASELVATLFDQAKQQDIGALYLITTSAKNYFKRKGFITIPRTEVPEALSQSREFNGLCPSSATVMFRKL